jgi:hypothetical protein
MTDVFRDNPVVCLLFKPFAEVRQIGLTALLEAARAESLRCHKYF